MLQVRVIPSLLLRGRGLYKTIKFRNPVYVGDPINAVRIFSEKGVDELVILDIQASLTNCGPNFELLQDIASEAFIPLCYGGGISSLEQMRRLFKLGFEKVSLNSALNESPELIKSAVRQFGSQSIVASIDVKKGFLGRYQVVTRCGTRTIDSDVVSVAAQAEQLGAGEILLNAIDRDGTMQGLDIGLIRSVTKVVNVPVVAAGGAGSLADIAAAIRDGGASAVAAGSLFVFEGKHRAVLITYPSEAEIAKSLG